MTQPLLLDVGVVGIVSYQWHVTWVQTARQVMGCLANYFQVVWVDPSINWRDTLRAGPASRPVFASVPKRPGLTIYRQEFWLPQFYRPEWLSRATYLARVHRAQKLLRQRGCKKVVLYLWTPRYDLAAYAGGWDLTSYHVDDEYSFSEIEVPTSPEEQRLLHSVDQVFIHSPTLMEKKGKENPHTFCSPNGVDYSAYATPAPEPKDLAPIPRPRIGYAGFIKRQLDWDLLRSLVIKHPKWSFVFAGKQSPHLEIDSVIAEMQTRPNVFFLGEKVAGDLASYPQHFDVCLMPYVYNDYTKYIYPLKMHEYLASGQPVVGTPLPAVVPFGHVLSLPQNREEWSDAIHTALRPELNSPEARAARQTVAIEHDWNFLTGRIAEIMAGRLGPEYAERLRSRIKRPNRARSRF
jgi:Glycosyl transferases group 1